METSRIHTFDIPALKSHLFDPERTSLLRKVRFRNHVLQKVIELMSLSRSGSGRNTQRGRISYAQLGINQLGAVYEALLSYKGFFAKTDLYEVKKAGEQPTELDTAYFFPADDLPKYNATTRRSSTGRHPAPLSQRNVYLPPGRPGPSELRILLYAGSADQVPRQIRPERTPPGQDRQ
jgi:hypothetical protein